MLEPDSYIVRQKGRQPIVNIEQREQLWSTSGLVDAVILLPEKEVDVRTKNIICRSIGGLLQLFGVLMLKTPIG